MTTVLALVKCLLFKFKLWSLMPGKDTNRNQSGLSGSLLIIQEGGFLVSLSVAGGCLECVHWMSRWLIVLLSFSQRHMAPAKGAVRAGSRAVPECAGWDDLPR